MEKFNTIAKLAILLAGVSGAAPAHALTGADIMEKMDSDERFAYVAGAIEMAAFLSQVNGQPKKADCIMDWYFDRDTGTKQVYQALSHFNDRQAHPVIVALINKTCGK